MHESLRIHRALAAGGFLVLAMLGACAEFTPTGPSDPSGVEIMSTSARFTSDDIIVPGADLGAFANPLVVDNSGWLTTEFWDNTSTDGVHCNVGYYALGTLDADCLNPTPGTYENRGGGYTRYWGDGAQHRQASSFMFNGSYGYVVTLKGTYAAEGSELGWFTVTGGVYTFHPVTGWGNKVVGSSAIIHPADGANWGLYIKHADHPVALTCAVNYDCSDATGDIHGGVSPVQQFALLANADGSKYLVGVEDNAEETAEIPGDDDFNDFLLSVAPFPTPLFVIGDVEAHGVGDAVNFWGAQWWKNNGMSGLVSNGVASFKGYATEVDGLCGGVWSSLPGNSSNPPSVIPQDVAIIVTSTVVKRGSIISGGIKEILIVHQDAAYGPNPGHAGNGQVTSIVCPQPD